MSHYRKESFSADDAALIREAVEDSMRYESNEIRKDWLWFSLVSRLEVDPAVTAWLDRSTEKDVPEMVSAISKLFDSEKGKE